LANPYVPPTIPGSYNLSPPPDDGTLTTANTISWNGLNGTAGIVSKLTGPLVSWINSINGAITAAFSAVASGVIANAGLILVNSALGVDPAVFRSFLSGLNLSNDVGTPNSVRTTVAAVLSDTSGRMRPLVLGQAEADNWTGSSDRNSEANR